MNRKSWAQNILIFFKYIAAVLLRFGDACFKAVGRHIDATAALVHKLSLIGLAEEVCYININFTETMCMAHMVK